VQFGNSLPKKANVFQALHKIAVREQMCTLRVCEVLLQLMSTLIDLGLLAKKANQANQSLPANKEAENTK
jgi:hypothetical protein